MLATADVVSPSGVVDDQRVTPPKESVIKSIRPAGAVVRLRPRGVVTP